MRVSVCRPSPRIVAPDTAVRPWCDPPSLYVWRVPNGIASSASVAAVANVVPATRVVLGLASLFVEARALGPAWPCACPRGDNLSLHHALATAPQGSVLVCDAAGDVSHGYFGELMATDALRRGVAGIVIDGAIRDSAVLSRLRFPVFCRGFAPHPCTKEVSGRAASVTLAGVAVTTADVVVADADGVAFVPGDQLDDVLAGIEELERREQTIKEAMASGKRLADVLFGGDGDVAG